MNLEVEPNVKLDSTGMRLEKILAEIQTKEKENQEIESKIDALMNDLIESKCLQALIANRQSKIDKLSNQIANSDKLISDLKSEVLYLKEAKSIHKPILNPLNNIVVDKLIKNKTITSTEVENVMRSIDRGDFAPIRPYMDKPQQIGFGTTISAPHMHAHQLEIMRKYLRNAARAIDIGCGSGYFTIAMAKLMPCHAKIYGLDHISKICEFAKKNISKSHVDYITTNKIEIVCADGRKGWDNGAPYDVIYVGGAIPKIPQEMVDQLACGGTLVAPVGHLTQKLTCLQKNLDGEITISTFMDCMFGKLQDKHAQWPDSDDMDEENSDNKDKLDSSDGDEEEENENHMVIEEPSNDSSDK